ncbi:MAG: DUF1269 domain-containing protein [Gammaproteobacteria bacterium]|nr:MAG: DUF1269 domain-containing protein [Gammaproteobacteria bacterium]
MRRLYFLVPTIESATQIVDELLLARVDERHIHIAAKDHHALHDAHLPEANLLQESDFIPAVEKGLAVGGGTGILAGIVAVTFPPAGLVLGGGAILGLGVIGAGFGAWMSGMIGISIENSQLREFEQAIEEGQLLIMIDVAKKRVDEITDLVKKHHPEAEVEGTEPTIPAFP